MIYFSPHDLHITKHQISIELTVKIKIIRGCNCSVLTWWCHLRCRCLHQMTGRHWQCDLLWWRVVTGHSVTRKWRWKTLDTMSIDARLLKITTTSKKIILFIAYEPICRIVTLLSYNGSAMIAAIKLIWWWKWNQLSINQTMCSKLLNHCSEIVQS